MELVFILKSLISKQFIDGGISEGSVGCIVLKMPFRITVEGFIADGVLVADGTMRGAVSPARS
jgi:hypothetical protein